MGLLLCSYQCTFYVERNIVLESFPQSSPMEKSLGSLKCVTNLSENLTSLPCGLVVFWIFLKKSHWSYNSFTGFRIVLFSQAAVMAYANAKENLNFEPQTVSFIPFVSDSSPDSVCLTLYNRNNSFIASTEKQSNHCLSSAILHDLKTLASQRYGVFVKWKCGNRAP